MRCLIMLCVLVCMMAGCGAISEGSSERKMISRIMKDCKVDSNANGATLTIRKGEAISGRKCVIFIVKLAPKKNLVAVYEDENGKYTFIGKVDTFMELEDLQVMPIRGSISNLVVVRERAEQLLGAQEDGVYIRAYIYDKDKFSQVLSIVEDYRAYTNQGSGWKRVAQTAQILWENEMYPIVNVLQSQNYAQSSETDAKEIPADSQFDILKNRNVKSIYRWSDKWKHFILAEGSNTADGRDVAIIMDWSETPFGLAEEFKKQTEYYLVKYKDGTLENVTKENIKILGK